MRIHTARLTAGLLLACALAATNTGNAAPPATSTAPATASAANSLEAEQEAAFKAAKAVQKAGPADIPLRDQAHLKLPEGYIWVPTPAAAQLMRSMGNRTDDTFIGAIFPADDADWMAVVKFVKEGYIKDDDAKDWNADDLLKSLKEGTEAANEERAKRGIPGIEVTGWAQKPQYEAQTHRLVWSALSKKKGDTGDRQGVNYNTYALGRDGYLSLNLITNAKDLDTYKPDAAKLLAALQYDDGKKYADFNSSTDKVAAYGLAALVAGVAVKKLGLFALALAFLAKFAKIAVVAGGAALWGIAKIFKKKTPEA
ncbi:DUF2167 domain-containing protein [Variovorax sp. IB41]|uniref:DUF2167 domain-containing protein n=1 Tax=Variovorax sp. IB41 TaxID=2779370 RepID=UPI0018E86DB8|nr:DUF2167 domain-containing protein [Variovorax sp. IB41]MBJ2156521.1 DUF2167 domain-containing protein [Variovorax sp. IB41]